MLENAHTALAVQTDIDALRERFPRTADLYREACAVMFFRYGLTPTTNSLYQLVRKGSMSVPAEALRQFWKDLRERARVDLQHADLPDQVKQSAGKLVGEIWTLAREAADESIATLQHGALVERDTALAENVRLEKQAAEISVQLEEVRAQAKLAETTIADLREQLSADAATIRVTTSRLDEARSEIAKLGTRIDTMSGAHSREIDTVTVRIVQAEQRYTDLEKRTLVDLDRERTAASKLQKQLDVERRSFASRIEEAQAMVLSVQAELARQGQELGAYMAKAELFSEERDRSAQHAVDSVLQIAELDRLLAAERARVIELREQVMQRAVATKPVIRRSRADSVAPRQSGRSSRKLDK